MVAVVMLLGETACAYHKVEQKRHCNVGKQSKYKLTSFCFTTSQLLHDKKCPTHQKPTSEMHSVVSCCNHLFSIVQINLHYLFTPLLCKWALGDIDNVSTSLHDIPKLGVCSENMQPEVNFRPILLHWVISDNNTSIMAVPKCREREEKGKIK